MLTPHLVRCDCGECVELDPTDDETAAHLAGFFVFAHRNCARVQVIHGLLVDAAATIAAAEAEHMLEAR